MLTHIHIITRTNTYTFYVLKICHSQLRDLALFVNKTHAVFADCSVQYTRFRVFYLFGIFVKFSCRADHKYIRVMDMENMCIVENEMEGSRGDRKEGGKRGRKPGKKSADKADMRAKLERSRQSARECRARKKLRYQYLEELVTDREKAVLALRRELDVYRSWGKELDAGRVPEGIQKMLEEFGAVKKENNNN